MNRVRLNRVNLTNREIEHGHLGPLGTDDPGKDPPAGAVRDDPREGEDTKERAA